MHSFIGTGHLSCLWCCRSHDAVDHMMMCRRAECDFGLRVIAPWLLLFFVSDSNIAVGLECSATTALSSGVPRGSILGPVISTYVSPFDYVVRAHLMQYHQYADDLMLNTELVPSMFSEFSSNADCTDAISTRFMENALLLNPAKTEAVIFGTRQRLVGLDIMGGVNVAGSTVQFSDALKLLGVTLDSSLSFDKHETNIVHACTSHTPAVRHIRPLWTLETANAIAAFTVGSRLDYCNSLLDGIRVEFRLTSAGATYPGTCHIPSSVVSQCSWSLTGIALAGYKIIRQCVHLKFRAVTFKAKHCGLPAYLYDDLEDY